MGGCLRPIAVCIGFVLAGTVGGVRLQAQGQAAAAANLYDNVKAYALDVTTIAPLHGQVVPWGDFLRFVGETE